MSYMCGRDRPGARGRAGASSSSASHCLSLENSLSLFSVSLSRLTLDLSISEPLRAQRPARPPGQPEGEMQMESGEGEVCAISL